MLLFKYTRNDLDFRRATFRVRGDTIDVYPADSDSEALRIELFGDEIEKLSWFDPLTGAIIKDVPRATIFPKTHYVTPKETVLNCIDSIKDELKERLDYLRSINKKAHRNSAGLELAHHAGEVRQLRHHIQTTLRGHLLAMLWHQRHHVGLHF